jgi:hypothetical protein
MTISMLSKWRNGTLLSTISDLTGVIGGGVSRNEYELARDLERDEDAAEVVAMDIGWMSAPELEISGLVTRSGSKSRS